MKIKDGNNEIPIRDSITEIISRGLYTPISIDTNVNNEDEHSVNLLFNENYLYENIISDTLNIQKEDNNKLSINSQTGANLQEGKGITIDSEDKINIDTRKFVDDKTINSDFIKWDGYGTYIKADLKDDKKEFFNSTVMEIYKPSSEYSWNTNRYIEKANTNKDNNKITVLNFRGTFFYPCYIASTIVIGGALTVYSGKVSILYVVCAKDNDMKFYYSQPSFSSISDTSTI